MHLRLYTALEYGLFSGSTMTFVYIDNLMTWTEAQTYCRLHYTDLASVRNMPENQKIDELVPAGVKVWIGLFRDSWKWTNGSNSSLGYWTIIEPNNLMGHESCVAANFLLNAKWEDWTCDSMKEFVCYIGKPCFRKSGLWSCCCQPKFTKRIHINKDIFSLRCMTRLVIWHN